MRRWTDGIADTVTSLDTVWQSQWLIERGTCSYQRAGDGENEWLLPESEFPLANGSSWPTSAVAASPCWCDSSFARTSGDQVASLVQDAAKHLILLHRRSPKPPESEADRRYKARSDPRYHRARTLRRGPCLVDLAAAVAGSAASVPKQP